MSRRDYTYVALVLWLVLGGIVDSYMLAQQDYVPFGPIDIVHIIMIVLLTWWWCCTDADVNNHERPNSRIMFFIVGFSPIGLAMYLFKTRTLAWAAIIFVAFYAGLWAATVIGGILGDFLVPFSV